MEWPLYPPGEGWVEPQGTSGVAPVPTWGRLGGATGDQSFLVHMPGKIPTVSLYQGAIPFLEKKKALLKGAQINFIEGRQNTGIYEP